MPRACTSARSTSTSKRSGALEGGGHRRHPRAARRAAGVAQHRPADLAPARPHAVGRAGRRSRSRSTARTSTRCARLAESAARAARRRSPGLVDLQVEKQVLHPAAPHRRRLRARRALRPDAGDGDAGAGDDVERAHGVADRRGQPPLRRGHAPLRPGPLDHRPRRSADRHARPGTCRCACSPTIEETDGPEPDPARERRSAASPSSATATAGATWRPSSPTSAASSAETQLAAGLRHAASRARSRRRRRRRCASARSRSLSLALIFVVLYSRYQSTGAGADHHGQHPARPDRQRDRAQHRRASRCRSRR